MTSTSIRLGCLGWHAFAPAGPTSINKDTVAHLAGVDAVGLGSDSFSVNDLLEAGSRKPAVAPRSDPGGPVKRAGEEGAAGAQHLDDTGRDLAIRCELAANEPADARTCGRRAVRRSITIESGVMTCECCTRRMMPAAGTSLDRAAGMLLGIRASPPSARPRAPGLTRRHRLDRSRVQPSTSVLLIREGSGALSCGNRVHPAELEEVAIGIGELALVHEAII